MSAGYRRKFNWITQQIGLLSGIIVLTVSCSSVPTSPGVGRSGLSNTPHKYSSTYKKKFALKKRSGFHQEGHASWYGKKFHGRKTSNGEIYDMNKLTAAHKTLPFGTHVTVKNVSNGKQVTVRINDRGPFVQGRIIDLSYAAAQKIDMVKSGTAMVEVVALGKPSDGKVTDNPKDIPPIGYKKGNYYEGNFTFQVGAFSNLENAERFKKKLSQLYNHVHVFSYDNGFKTLYRVRIGRCNDLNQAVRFEEYLIKGGHKEAFLSDTDGEYSFQLASFTDEKNATIYKDRISKLYSHAQVVPRTINDKTYYRVRVGRLSSLSQAVQFEKILKKGGYSQAFIVAE